VTVNVMDRSVLGLVRAHATARLRRFEAVVLLHTVFSNACYLAGTVLDAVAAIRAPKAYFIGNEYKLMPEKMAFCEALGVRLLVTMNPHPRAQAMYRDRLRCAVVHIPSAALDPERFRPVTPSEERPIDVGYRAFDAPWYLGHDERREIAEYFIERAPDLGLVADVSLDAADRFDETGWAAFLNRCKAQLGTEAGGDYFELTDRSRLDVEAFLKQRPDATLSDVRARFFDHHPDPVPVRTISGRHVEAAATRTAQVLFDGSYSGYLTADDHFIALRKDFSNIDDVVLRLRDAAYCRAMTDRAYDVVHETLTYDRLIDQFADALEDVL
jgi:hypothetical protein